MDSLFIQYVTWRNILETQSCCVLEKGAFFCMSI